MAPEEVEALITFYMYCGTLPLASPYSKKTASVLAQWDAYSRNAGWWWAYEDLDIISRRPISLSWENGIGSPLHNESGPSAEWRDGWKLWHIGGVRVDEQIVMFPETQTIEQIEQESNSEIRRVRIERFGWERYLNESHATLRDQRRNDRDAQGERLYTMSNELSDALSNAEELRGRLIGVDRRQTAYRHNRASRP